MKALRGRIRKSASILNSRWAAYATAGAASALGGINSAEADIHYSGPLADPVPLGESLIHSFALDNGAYISFANIYAANTVGGIALFRVAGASVSQMFVGIALGGYRYPSNLTSGANIAAGPFVGFNGAFFATLAYGPATAFPNSKFKNAGEGIIGFRFNGGAGIEYGWARINMSGGPDNAFTIVDYAWADPGTAITAGQIPEPGSLALLAVGAAGLLLWRKRRAKALTA